jgi:arylsulfatase A-like enzyme
VAPFFIWLSFVFFRLEQFRITHLSWPMVLQAGLIAGLLADLALVLWIEGIRRSLLSIHVSLSRFQSALTTIALWILLAANVCYFAFFQSELFLWVAASYHKNAWSVRGVALRLLERPWLLLSFATCSLALLLMLRGPRLALEKSVNSRFKHLLIGCLFIASALVVKQSPHWRWLHIPQIAESIFSDNIAWRWIEDARNGKIEARVPIDRYEEILPKAQNILSQYSKHEHPIPPRQKSSARLRERLGLPPLQKLNFVILFIESGRAYELLSPKTNRVIYPELRKVLSRHGILFSQTYSTANYTVQGQFSTLCSRMDRFDAAPIYMRQPYARVDCLPAVFKSQGYQTYWMNPYHRYFSGKYVFESNHGTEHFLDREFFIPRTPEERNDTKEWGVSDETFLSEALAKLENIHKEGKPFFAHLLTTGTHAPWQVQPKFPLSKEMLDWSAGSSDYAGYLSSARAFDHALGLFFEQFFKSPISNDTVVVVMGDHGTGVIPPNAQLQPLQTNLLWPRIILGVISKKMKNPTTLHHVVHQIDVAPLITAIAGIPQPKTWLGREPLLSMEGTTWIKRNGNRFLYRTPSRICGKLAGAFPFECWKYATNEDPLFTTEAPRLLENQKQTQWFKSVIKANEAILELASGGESVSDSNHPFN